MYSCVLRLAASQQCMNPVCRYIILSLELRLLARCGCMNAWSGFLVRKSECIFIVFCCCCTALCKTRRKTCTAIIEIGICQRTANVESWQMALCFNLAFWLEREEAESCSVFASPLWQVQKCWTIVNFNYTEGQTCQLHKSYQSILFINYL